MNSVLNPEAPEFRPHLSSIVQDGFKQVHKTIKTSNTLPTGNSYQVFKTFTDFNVVTSQISENVVVQSNQILVTELPKAVKLKPKYEENSTDKIIDANDSLLDRINVNIDTMSGVNKPSDKFAEGVNASNTAGMGAWNSTPVIAKIKVGSTTFIGAKNIPRPQLTFKDTIDNSESLWVPKISDKPNNIKPLALNILYNEDGEAVGYEHPYKVELDLYHPPGQFIDPDTSPPTYPPSVAKTKLTYIDTEAQLDALVEHLNDVTELAVDLEHHSYRTYQGITCLIQISTNEGGDFIIDALAVREHIHKLNLVFTDPKKLKVFHGAESDVVWLQRDFGVYIVGLFDTHQAAKVLQLSGLSLKYLLLKYCQISADKKYQLADWRMRPLPDELIEYARVDTHYLLYVWRRMKGELLQKASGQPQHLLSVFEQSRQICGATFHKEVVTDLSHIPLYVRSKKSFTSQQMAALKLLYKWRDTNARALDESTTYLLPNHMLLALAETLPREVQGVNAICNPMPPFVKQNLITIHRMLLSCRELPTEPQLYQMPTSIRNVVNMQSHPSLPTAYMHDFTHFPEFSDDQYSNMDFVNTFVGDTVIYQPDIQAFQSANKKEFVSELNAEAKLFIPPYDRYKNYRILAQIEEMKEFKEKEAKIAAISKGNELIKEEVLVKLQEAKKKAEIEETKETAQSVVIEVEDDEIQKKAALRKRKINEKLEQKDTVEPATDNKKKDVTQNNFKKAESNVKRYFYKNVNYKKFYSDNGKGYKQPRMNRKNSSIK